jgi:hypothetical protein
MNANNLLFSLPYLESEPVTDWCIYSSFYAALGFLPFITDASGLARVQRDECESVRLLQQLWTPLPGDFTRIHGS